MLGTFAKPFTLASKFYKVLGDLGAYEESRDYIDYMCKMRTYYNARKSFSEAFNRAKNDPSEENMTMLAAHFEATKVAAWRSVDKLTNMFYRLYTKNLNPTEVFLVESRLRKLTCPFAVSAGSA